ncbi:MAG: hypothetical protein BA871_14240 [Desulfuromonadales bacterium C00003096]|jgi:hypothetical protein|nr:MAG: hypothetical protein BA871_14240 [Desulfuromonadales bacterium C00003096]
MIDEGNENINKRDEGGDANGICCTTREDCESINGNVMKNRVGYKERLFETSRKGDLILRHIYLYIEKKPKISLLIKTMVFLLLYLVGKIKARYERWMVKA